MDESWRMRMGMTTKLNLPRRKSTEETSRRMVFGYSETIEADVDFNDVFGGPPRSVMCSRFSSDFTSSTLFYEEIFRQPEDVSTARSGRNLPEFRIPASRVGDRKSEGFYDDIFGSDEDYRRSRSRSKSKTNSKSTSSSVLSSEDLSPFRPAVADDVGFSVFASKLRPINVPCRWNSATMMPKESPRQQKMAVFSCNSPSNTENRFAKNEYKENFRGSQFGFLRRVSSPETITIEPDSYRSVMVSMDDLELNSPSSVVSSICQDSEVKASEVQERVLQEEEMEQEEDEVMSSYVIEINPDHGERTNEELGVDEAIAWAKEKFQTHCSEKNWSIEQHRKQECLGAEERANAYGFSAAKTDGNGSMRSQEKEPIKCATEEGKQQLEKDMEMELLDEDIRSWSSGKEANIRLLLSTLDHILWPNSGWHAISLTNLIESSHVKKAYQKARLCLHPDKLQQRGATLPQKYVAEKAFSILQGAWAAFISQDVCFS
ncbi:uncharacterized protein LOC132311756 isoform X2 [Cornus florida]|uniref:uncharacterized protein LOC132311756 isoform X2 n=1 Tax=Cornus florida TaxID=4283 RepID=UPI00289BD5E0|nr:uncharacterized protein LOC132311756 isoform X2 [Cornus florida]